MTTRDRLTLRNAYLYLVCLITLVVSLFAAVQLVRGVVALAYPDPSPYGYYGHPMEPAPEDIPEDELRRQEEIARDSQRRYEILEMVGSGATLLIAGPVYLYHWRRIQTERPARAGVEAVDAPA